MEIGRLGFEIGRLEDEIQKKRREHLLFFATIEKQVPNKKIRHYTIPIWKFI